MDTTEAKPRPRARKVEPVLGEHELAGLVAEAWWVYDMQDDMTRFDSRHRRWAFASGQVGGHSHLILSLRRGEDERTVSISTAQLATDTGREQLESLVRQLDLAL